nr:translation initiation factor IF-2-like [Saimiri boliviensis boliviensis]
MDLASGRRRTARCSAGIKLRSDGLDESQSRALAARHRGREGACLQLARRREGPGPALATGTRASAECPRPRPPARTTATPGRPSERARTSRRAPGALQLRPRPTHRHRPTGATASGRFSRLLGNGTLREAQVHTENTRRQCSVCTAGRSRATLRPASRPSPPGRLGAKRGTRPAPQSRSGAHATQWRPLGSRGVRQGRGAGIPFNLSMVIGDDRRRGGRIGGRGGASRGRLWRLRGATEAEAGSEAALGSGGRRRGSSRPAPPRPSAASAPPSAPADPRAGPAGRAGAESLFGAGRWSLSSPGDLADRRPPRQGILDFVSSEAPGFPDGFWGLLSVCFLLAHTVSCPLDAGHQFRLLGNSGLTGPPWSVLGRAPCSGWRLFLRAASQKRPEVLSEHVDTCVSCWRPREGGPPQEAAGHLLGLTLAGGLHF